MERYKRFEEFSLLKEVVKIEVITDWADKIDVIKKKLPNLKKKYNII